MTVVTKSFILKVTGLLCPTLKRIDKFWIICLFKINKRNTNNVSNMFKNNKDTGTILLTFVLVFLLLSLNIFRTLFYWYNSWIWTNTAGPKKLVALDKKITFCNCDIHIVPWAEKTFWATYFHRYLPKIWLWKEHSVTKISATELQKD